MRLRRCRVLQAPQNILSPVENHLCALQPVITVAVALIPETMQEVQNQYALFCPRIESSVIGAGQLSPDASSSSPRRSTHVIHTKCAPFPLALTLSTKD